MNNPYIRLMSIILINSLFFMWAMSSSMIGILTKYFSDNMHLSHFQAGLTNFAFYMGYFVTAIPASMLARKINFKNSILIGLMLFAIGSFIFYPASITNTYSVFLLALFISATGLTFLETCASAYIVELGEINFATRRLNLAQSFNGLGLVSTVYFTGALILNNKGIYLYLPFFIIGCGASFLLVLFIFMPLPKINGHINNKQSSSIGVISLLKINLFRQGILSTFCYTGAQAGMWGYFLHIVSNKLPLITNVSANKYYCINFVLFTLGRFISTFFLRYIQPQAILKIYSLASIMLLMLTILLPGTPAVVTIIATSFFMSAMYPTIFSLSLQTVQSESQLASGLLVTAIIGGAILPLLMGILADIFNNIVYGLIVPIICFANIYSFAQKSTTSYHPKA